MAKYLYRLGLWSTRNSKKVLLGGLAFVLVIIILALALGPKFSTETSIPGLKSEKAMELLAEEFPSPVEEGGQIEFVFKAPDNTNLTTEPEKQTIQKYLKDITNDPEVKSITDPYERMTISSENEIGYATITYNQPDVSEESKANVNQIAEAMRLEGWQAELTGSGYSSMAASGAGVSPTEMIGVVVAFVVLSITFSSFLTGILPILTALISLIVGIMCILISTNILDMSISSISVAVMLGLAVGIDYAMFIMSRFRQQLAEGYDIQTSAAIANATAGTSVVFAGMTVIIGLGGLAVARIPFITAMGIAAGFSVLAAVLVAIIIMPAILGVLGERIGYEKQNRYLAIFNRTSKKGKKNSVNGWGKFVTKRPWAIVISGVLLLCLLATPVLHLNLGIPNDAQKPTTKTERRAYDLRVEGFGAGYNSSIVVLAQGNNEKDSTAYMGMLTESLKTVPNVKSISPAIPGKSGKVNLVSITPLTGTNDIETKDLVKNIRDKAAELENNGKIEFFETGSTVVNIDISEHLNTAILKFAIVVLVLAFILLLLLFRSLLIPIKAVLGFALSLVATFGFLVFVFQDGHLGPLFGVHASGPILNFLPIMVVGVLFGLAMDYEVFLVSRMREEFKHTGDAQRAVLAGIKGSGAVVTAAGLIMISVFAGFILSDESMVKAMGFALAFGILFDAFVVRLTLVPAIMTILGKSAWYLPKWLDRILPNVDIEGEEIMKEVSQGKGYKKIPNHIWE